MHQRLPEPEWQRRGDDRLPAAHRNQSAHASPGWFLHHELDQRGGGALIRTDRRSARLRRRRNFILDCIGNTRSIWTWATPSGPANYAQLPGAWHHFAVVAASNIYLNSVQILPGRCIANQPLLPGQRPKPIYPTRTPTPPCALVKVHRREAILIRSYGRIDDVRIYNRAFSSNEVAQLYAYESTSESIQITGDLTNFYAVYAGHDTIIGVTASATSPLRLPMVFSRRRTTPGKETSGYAQIISGFVYGAVVTNGGYGVRQYSAGQFCGAAADRAPGRLRDGKQWRESPASR